MRSHLTSKWLPFLILLLASALTYLPFVTQIGFSNDDWYLVYGAHVRGPAYFAPAYERDRPLRAYVLAPEYSLFGDNPLPYHLTMYAFRLLSAASLFWLLNQLWPGRRRTAASPDVARNRETLDAAFVGNRIPNLLISLLFLLYPGFLSQPNPVDYQSQIIALFAATLSLALTVAALHAGKMYVRVIYTLLSILLAWFYLGLIDYYLGLEALRLLSVYLVVKRQAALPEPATKPGFMGMLRRNFDLRTRIWPTIGEWLPFAFGPELFLIWRLFFFTSTRSATDVSLQLGAVVTSPAQTGLWWLARFMQDTLNVIFLAWGVPLYNLAFNQRLTQTWIGIGLAAVVAVGVVVILGRAEQPKAESEANGSDWRAEMGWVGLVSAVAGLVPVILANRHVEFFSLSRYTLASSAGAAMVMVALLSYLAAPRLRWALAGLLIAASVWTQFANGAIAARNTQTMNEFWWQVSWRAPQLRAGTTLTAYYPAPLQEDYFLWGAANLIYNPQPQIKGPAEAPISGVLLTPDNLTRILTGKGADTPDRRNTHIVMDFGNVLVLTQAGFDSCVRVLDGSQPELSASDDSRIMLVAHTSKLEDVIPDGSHPAMNTFVFGPEPPHAWCWYYEQASLARQQGDWQKVAALGDEALKKGFYPSDSVEWFPFMQAYAALGRDKDLKHLSTILGADPFLEQQACAILTKMAQTGSMKPELASSALSWYCGK